MPKVTVVVPNFNHENFLRQRIESILAQSYQDYELLLLDDASTDNSRDILMEYSDRPNVRLLFNETNSGSAFKQWNVGFREACGEYVWIAESDDYAEPEFLDTLVSALESHPETGIACCRSWIVDKNGQTHGIAEQTCFDPETFRKWDVDHVGEGKTECAESLILRNFVLNASAVLFRKSVVESVGYADDTLRLAGDWKLYGEMLMQSDIAFVSPVLNYFRKHETNVRSTVKSSGRHIIEPYIVISYIVERLGVREDVLEECRSLWCENWIRDNIHRAIVPGANIDIYRAARAFDPHITRRLINVAFKIAIGKLHNSRGNSHSNETTDSYTRPE